MGWRGEEERRRGNVGARKRVGSEKKEGRIEQSNYTSKWLVDKRTEERQKIV